MFGAGGGIKRLGPEGFDGIGVQSFDFHDDTRRVYALERYYQPDMQEDAVLSGGPYDGIYLSKVGRYMCGQSI